MSTTQTNPREVPARPRTPQLAAVPARQASTLALDLNAGEAKDQAPRGVEMAAQVGGSRL